MSDATHMQHLINHKPPRPAQEEILGHCFPLTQAWFRICSLLCHRYLLKYDENEQKCCPEGYTYVSTSVCISTEVCFHEATHENMSPRFLSPIRREHNTCIVLMFIKDVKMSLGSQTLQNPLKWTCSKTIIYQVIHKMSINMIHEWLPRVHFYECASLTD